jgi:AcrR family transcriptional regulator
VSTATPSYKGHRYPVEIINNCLWLYFRFSLSFRKVEELMLARGVVVSYETIRRWCAKFGPAYANQLVPVGEPRPDSRFLIRSGMPEALETITRRKTQAERSATSRELIMRATVTILEEEGLAGATTVRIQEEAGLSRGRLLHHFPSREVLLVAAVQHVAKARWSTQRQSLTRKRGRARILAAIDALWLTYEGSLFWAAMELWLGARTDSTLREHLLPQEEQLTRIVWDLCDELFGRALVAKPAYADFRDILISSMRGVAMTYAYNDRPKKTDPHREMWLRMGMTMLQVGSQADA